MLICVSLAVSMIGAVASASSPLPPTHFHGDPNFILITEQPQSNTAWYIDRSSLVVSKYEPPQYIIAVNICMVTNANQGNDASIQHVVTNTFFYNWDLKRMYWDAGHGDQNWIYIAPTAPRATAMVGKPGGEMAFYLAYNMKFYGSGAGYSNSFYARAR